MCTFAQPCFFIGCGCCFACGSALITACWLRRECRPMLLPSEKCYIIAPPCTNLTITRYISFPCVSAGRVCLFGYFSVVLVNHVDVFYRISRHLQFLSFFQTHCISSVFSLIIPSTCVVVLMRKVLPHDIRLFHSQTLCFLFPLFTLFLFYHQHEHVLLSLGKGHVYGYDAIGSFEEIPYGCVGSSMHLITSLLDNQVGFKTQPSNKRELTLDETVELVKDALTCAGERDIYTGDSADIWVITAAGTQKISFDLKND